MKEKHGNARAVDELITSERYGLHWEKLHKREKMNHQG